MTTEEKTLSIEEISEKLMDISEQVGYQMNEVEDMPSRAVYDVEYTCGDISGELESIRSELVDLSIDLGKQTLAPKGVAELNKKMTELLGKLPNEPNK